MIAASGLTLHNFTEEQPRLVCRVVTESVVGPLQSSDGALPVLNGPLPSADGALPVVGHACY